MIIYFYYTNRKWGDSNYTKDECTALVFENNKLTGWGDEFYENMLRSSRTEAEQAVVMLLWRTGMHSSTLVSRPSKWFIRGDYIIWKRTKPGQTKSVILRAKVPRAELKLIEQCYTAGSRPTSQGILRRWLRAIGKRAGYAEQAVSPLTFRHSRAVYLLDRGMPVHRVAAVLGCSYTTLEKHYAQLEAERLV